MKLQNVCKTLFKEETTELASIEKIISILKDCRKDKCVISANIVNLHIHECGLENNSAIGNYLVPMLVECGGQHVAMQVFHKLQDRNEFSWTSVIQGFIDCGELQQALFLFQRMKEDCIQPSIYTLQALVKACAWIKCIATGLELHAEITKNEFDTDLILGNTLVDLYAKCGMFVEAWDVLMSLPIRDAISWNALMTGYIEHGLAREALNCLSQMESDAVSPDEVTYLSALKGCVSLGTINRGRELHAEIVRDSLELFPFIGNSLIDLYAKCGFLSEAEDVLNDLPVQDVVSWNAIIIGYAEHGYGVEALDCFQQMQIKGIPPDSITFIGTLKACGNKGLTCQSQALHAQIVKEGYDIVSSVGNILVDTYARCGSIFEALEILLKLPNRNVVSWTALISACVEHGLGEAGLSCWDQMQADCVFPNAITFVSVLQSCSIAGSIDKGLKVHRMVIEEGLENDPCIASVLVDMFSKCALFSEAEEVLNDTLDQDVVLWTALIAGYGEHGHGHDALRCFDQMLFRGIFPNLATSVCCMKACNTVQAVERGKELHAMIIKCGFEDHFLSNAMVDMYGKCGLITEAQKVFDDLEDHSTVSWNALISAYVDKGLEGNAMDCFQEMAEKRVPFNDVTLICVLKTCGSTHSLSMGQQLHSEIIRYGYEYDRVIANTLVDMYAKCGSISEACWLFEAVPDLDVVAWNALLVGYCEHGIEYEVMNCLDQMHMAQISPNAVTCLCILKSCATVQDKDIGQETHVEIVKKGFDNFPHIGNTLVDLYIKCGLIPEAMNVFRELDFRDVIVWTTVIAGLSEHDQPEEAMKSLDQMRNEGVSPSSVTFLCSLKGWSNNRAICSGYSLHADIVKYGFEEDPMVGSALVGMYAKSAILGETLDVFNRLSDRLLVSWTSTIMAYCEDGMYEDALSCLPKMMSDRLSPDTVAYLGLLKACGSAGVVDKGVEIHSDIVKQGINKDEFISGALVDMYAKCGLLEEAWNTFNELPSQTVIAWTTVIAAFACQGKSKLVFHLLDRMVEAEIDPDEVTLLSVLTACSHDGLVDIGYIYFDIFSKQHSVKVNIEHQNCMLDLLSRAGQLNEAIIWVEVMPFHPNFISWRTILGACKKWGNMQLAMHAFDFAVNLGEQHAAPFVLLSNLHVLFESEYELLYNDQDLDGGDALSC